MVVEKGCPMGSLFEELEAREAAAHDRVKELEIELAELAELADRLDNARQLLERLRIARETVAEVMAEMSEDPAKTADADDVLGTPRWVRRRCLRTRVWSVGWWGC
ncbi:hypothetical protein AB0B50_38920 [Streptomyces sp. NPDC041068]|uniref:hypothetical protein n=1 Tax=Streptomyces sp. NPDC041068 TaxID=3155130 RepID=UPI0033EC1B97